MLVAVIHTKSHQRFEWTIQCFETRMFAMRELYRKAEHGVSIDVPEIADPFYENPDADVRIGTARLYLQPLTYMVRVKENLEIINLRAEVVGLMEVCRKLCVTRIFSLHHKLVVEYFPVFDFSKKQSYQAGISHRSSSFRVTNMETNTVKMKTCSSTIPLICWTRIYPSLFVFTAARTSPKATR